MGVIVTGRIRIYISHFKLPDCQLAAVRISSSLLVSVQQLLILLGRHRSLSLLTPQSPPLLFELYSSSATSTMYSFFYNCLALFSPFVWYFDYMAVCAYRWESL